MHFDNFFISLWKDEYEPKINNKNLIKKRFSNFEGSKELYIIFPPWHSKLKYDKFLRKFIQDQGASCLEYKFNGHFLSSDYRMTKKYFNFVKRRIVQELIKLKNKYNFSKINFVGISLGCVNACMIAREFDKVEKLILVVPGNCLAESLWNGIKTKKLRKGFERKGINLDKLKKSWRDLAPENNINKINYKKMKIYISKSDKVIPYTCGSKLIEKVKNKRRLKVFENRFLGHYLTAIKFYLFPKRFFSN